jgi:hypothetical protein
MFLPRRIDETWARRERDGRRSNPLALALSVRSFAVQLGVAPLRRGCPPRPVSLERLGVTVVSCSASLTRRGGAERSLRPLAHLVRMHKRLAGTLLGAPQASPRILSHSAPLSRRPRRQEPGRGVGEQRRRDLTPALSLALSVPSHRGVATPLRIRPTRQEGPRVRAFSTTAGGVELLRPDELACRMHDDLASSQLRRIRKRRLELRAPSYLALVCQSLRALMICQIRVRVCRAHAIRGWSHA